MDLSKLSDDQLRELKTSAGDLTRLSDDTLRALKGSPQGEMIQEPGTGKHFRVGPKGEWTPSDAPAPKQSLAGLHAQGATDMITGTLGLPVDAVNWGLSKIGLGSEKPIGGSASLRGVADYVATAPGRVADAVSQGSLAPFADDRTSRQTPQDTLGKVAYGTGTGTAGVATMMGPASMLAQGAKSPVTRAVAGDLLSSPGTQVAASATGGAVGEAADNPWYGMGTAAVVGAVPSLARAMMRPNVGSLTPEQTRLAKVAGAEGIPLSTGQQTGSKSIQTLESVLGNLPISGGMVKAQTQAQREAFTAAALRRAGIDSKTAAPEVLAGRQAELGKTFNDVTRRANIPVDDPLVEDFLGIADKYLPKIEPTKRGIVKSYIDDITKPGRDVIPGDMYQETRSLLRNQANSYAGQDYATSKALKGIRNALDAAMERAVPPADAAAFKQANRQYANLKTIAKAMEGAGGDVATGGLSPARLRMATTQSAKGNYATGAGDLNELARVGEAFVKPQIPDSGTAQRMMWQGLLSGGALGVGATGNLPAAAAMMATAPAAQKLLQSSGMRNYLTRPRGKMNPREVLASVLTEQDLKLLQDQRR